MTVFQALDTWESKRLGSTVSMRTFTKAALMHKYNLPKSADISQIRKMLKDKKIVDPKSLFVSLLSQGVLLLNASLSLNGKKEKTKQKCLFFSFSFSQLPPKRIPRMFGSL
jgi:hypothetical protein